MCENFVVERRYAIEASFRYPKTLPFRIDYSSNSNVFSKTPSWTPFLLDFIMISYGNDRVWDTLKIQWASKWDPESTKWHQKESAWSIQSCSWKPFETHWFVDAFWSPFAVPVGSNWLLFPTLLVYVLMLVHALSTDFRAVYIFVAQPCGLGRLSKPVNPEPWLEICCVSSWILIPSKKNLLNHKNI